VTDPSGFIVKAFSKAKWPKELTLIKEESP